MKIYGNEKTNLRLTEKAFKVYSESDPLTIIEQDDGSYSLRGMEHRDGMTEADVNAWLEELGDEGEYAELRAAALSPAATQEDINALGEWFECYGRDNPGFWNGEYWDADGGMRLFPVYTEPDEYGDSEIVGYEFR